jgi:hypothetical protein
MSKMAARMQSACDDPRSIEDWEIGLRLLESRSFLQTQPQLRRRMPLAFRYLAPVLAREYARWFNAYKVNLCVVDRSRVGP